MRIFKGNPDHIRLTLENMRALVREHNERINYITFDYKTGRKFLFLLDKELFATFIIPVDVNNLMDQIQKYCDDCEIGFVGLLEEGGNEKI